MLDLLGSQLDTELVGHRIQHSLHVVLVLRTAVDTSLWGHQNVQHVLLGNLQL